MRWQRMIMSERLRLVAGRPEPISRRVIIWMVLHMKL
jgi:hypothetical protein